MRKLVVVVLCFWMMMVCPIESQDRWRLVSKTVPAGDLVYIDIATIIRPSQDVVIFWEKICHADDGKESFCRIKMWRADRKFQAIGSSIQGSLLDIVPIDIVPGSTMECFYNALFK